MKIILKDLRLEWILYMNLFFSNYFPFIHVGEQALAILKKAGEDLAKFGHMLSSIKTSMDNSSIPNMAS